MLYRLISTLKHLNHRSLPASGFDSYLANIQRSHAGGGPRIEEARKDFASRVHNETSGLLGG